MEVGYIKKKLIKVLGLGKSFMVDELFKGAQVLLDQENTRIFCAQVGTPIPQISQLIALQFPANLNSARARESAGTYEREHAVFPNCIFSFLVGERLGDHDRLNSYRFVAQIHPWEKGQQMHQNNPPFFVYFPLAPIGNFQKQIIAKGNP